jgi:hypothetical protein
MTEFSLLQQRSKGGLQMSFDKNLVKYSRIIHQGPLSANEKEKLKQEINAIIDAATRSITIEAIVQPPMDDQEKY